MERPFKIFWAVLSSDGCIHRVHVQHNQITGHRIVEHNGVRIVDERILCDIGSRHELPLLRHGRRTSLRRSPSLETAAAHKPTEIATVVIASCRMGTAYRYDLQVDNTPFAEWNASLHRRSRFVAFDISSAWADQRPLNGRQAFLTYTPGHQRIFTGGSLMCLSEEGEPTPKLTTVPRSDMYGMVRELANAAPEFPMDERSGTIHNFTLASRDVFFEHLHDDASHDAELAEPKPDYVTAFELHADLVTEAFSLTAVALHGSNTDASPGPANISSGSAGSSNAARVSFRCILEFDALLDIVPELAHPFVIERGKPLPRQQNSAGSKVGRTPPAKKKQQTKKNAAASSWLRRSKRK